MDGTLPLETPTQETPAQEAPAQETPAQEAPTQETPTQETPAQETPAQETPAQETPAQETPAAVDEPQGSAFAQFGLSPALLAQLEKHDYTDPTPIQAQTIPLLLEGRDVLGQAQTGTGKTAAFALPLLDRIDLSNPQTQVLVLAPTRELAMQVAGAFEKYGRELKGLRVASIYGGQDYQVQFRQLDRGPQVVVGTPGRVMDHMRRGSLKLDHLQCLVLDEADEMLRMGFAEDVEWVLTESPAERQMALFSATMPPSIRSIAQKHLKDHSEITIGQKVATADTIEQRYIVVAAHDKQAALARILEAESPDGVLVFVKTRKTTEPLAEYLAQAGFKTAALSGELAQKQRERIVDRLRSGRVDVVVATDVAARGLDVQRISHVVNYDLPFDSEAYIHRIGRTGRAGRSGQAILFVHPRERRLLKRLEQATRKSIEQMELPSNREINKARVAKFHQAITESLGDGELETFQQIIAHYQRENDVPLEMIAASLAVLANQGTSLLVKENVKQTSFAGDGRRDRADKGASGGKHGRGGHRYTGAMQTYRVEVGRSHQVRAGNLVGAIANETGMSSESIGKIKIYDKFSTVDLPQDTPQNVLSTLQQVYVGGRKLQISVLDDFRPRPRPANGKRPFGKAKTKGRKSNAAR